MQEIMTDFLLSLEIDNEILLEEISDNSYQFEDELESHIDWSNEITRWK